MFKNLENQNSGHFQKKSGHLQNNSENFQKKSGKYEKYQFFLYSGNLKKFRKKKIENIRKKSENLWKIPELHVKN